MNYSAFSFTDNSAVITHTRRTYTRTASGRNWKSKPDRETVEPVTAEFYTNFVQATPFFKSRVTWAYTRAGYLPTALVSISPGRDVKHVDMFAFDYF